MTEAKINIEISKILGWTNFEVYTGGYVYGVPPNYLEHHPVPNYCKDLNATHKLENAADSLFTANQWWEYISYLNGFSSWEEWWGELTDTDKLDAVVRGSRVSAKEKAVAFLKVMGVLAKDFY